MNILGLTGQHKIARKSGRKFILKFSPQADFNFVQPCIGSSSLEFFSCTLLKSVNKQRALNYINISVVAVDFG